MRLVLAEMAKICKHSEHAAENAWLTGSAVEEIICLLGLMHASCDEGLKCHAIHFRWGHEMARWQYQGDTLRSQVKCDWYWQKWHEMVEMRLFGLMHASCFMWWRTQVSCHPFSMRPWNGSLTISRGHPEKPVGMCLVLAEMAWNGGNAFVWLDACFMWWRTQVSCHPFSMRPWNGSLTISRGHPEKPVGMRLVLAEMAWMVEMRLFGLMHASCDEGLKCHAIHFRWGHEMARWQYQGDTLRSQLECVWYWQKWHEMVEMRLFGLMDASCDEGLKCHAIHFRWGHEMARWQYQGDTLRSQLECVWYWQKWHEIPRGHPQKPVELFSLFVILDGHNGHFSWLFCLLLRSRSWGAEQWKRTLIHLESICKLHPLKPLKLAVFHVDANSIMLSYFPLFVAIKWLIAISFDTNDNMLPWPHAFLLPCLPFLGPASPARGSPKQLWQSMLRTSERPRWGQFQR